MGGFDLKRTLEMDPEFLNTENEHEHDDTVSSLSIKVEGELDFQLVQPWVKKILTTKAQDIYRMKGVLAIADANEKFVYQAVHMIFNGHFEDECWKEGEKRESKMVFIGKNLDKDELRKGFESCLYDEEQSSLSSMLARSRLE